MKHIFEPLSQKPRAVILDTDIGPDCDDVGAIVTLIHYAKAYGFPILGVCNCTSNDSGTGTVDAIFRHCGMPTPALGQWSHPDFLTAPHCRKYNDAIAEQFSPDYRSGTLKVEDEVTFYRRLLAGAEDDGVMLVTIGMLNDLAALLVSPADEWSPLSGAELVRAKVNCLVSMATILPEGRECNIVEDYPAATAVFAAWPTPIYLSDFHIGFGAFSGYTHITADARASHAPAMAYYLYTKDWTEHVGENNSFDLTAVQFAALGEGELYGLAAPGRVEFYAELPDRPDATRYVPDPEGNVRYMTRKVELEVVAESLNEILHQY